MTKATSMNPKHLRPGPIRRAELPAEFVLRIDTVRAEVTEVCALTESEWRDHSSATRILNMSCCGGNAFLNVIWPSSQIERSRRFNGKRLLTSSSVCSPALRLSNCSPTGEVARISHGRSRKHRSASCLT